MNEKLWDGPVELFFWDGRLSLRDAKKKNIFHVDLDTREYHTVKKLKEKILPKIVEMMNAYEAAEQLIESAQDSVKTSVTAPVLSPVPAKRGNPWGRKGKPK